MTTLDTYVSLNDLSIDPTTGIGSISRRGLAKLCDVKYQSWGQTGDSIFTKKIDEFLAGQGIGGDSILDSDNRILDFPASMVVKFYAYNGNEQARLVDCALSAIGMRAAIQDALGYTRQKVSSERIINILVRDQSTDWVKRFSDEFYSELSRLTGLTVSGNKRPGRFAALTRDFLYLWLPSGVYSRLKACQTRDRSVNKHEKLHQYLSEIGLQVLETDMADLLKIMKLCANVSEVYVALERYRHGQYQIPLF